MCNDFNLSHVLVPVVVVCFLVFTYVDVGLTRYEQQLDQRETDRESDSPFAQKQVFMVHGGSSNFSFEPPRVIQCSGALQAPPVNVMSAEYRVTGRLVNSSVDLNDACAQGCMYYQAFVSNTKTFDRLRKREKAGSVMVTTHIKHAKIKVELHSDFSKSHVFVPGKARTGLLLMCPSCTRLDQV
jgi:hypothetical protein